MYSAAAKARGRGRHREFSFRITTDCALVQARTPSDAGLSAEARLLDSTKGDVRRNCEMLIDDANPVMRRCPVRRQKVTFDVLAALKDGDS
jgi:hypothetical protein